MPDMQEMLNDPRALAEGKDQAAKLNPQHLVELVVAQKSESEEYNRKWRTNAQKFFELWQNKVDFPDKEEWQTQLWVPKVFSAVEQATALIQRSLLDSPEAFGIEGNNETDRFLATAVWKPLLKILLDKGDFVYKFSDAAKMGFITGVAGYLKFRPALVNVPSLMAPQMPQMPMGMDPQMMQMMQEQQQSQNMAGIRPQFTTKQKQFIQIDFVPPQRIWRDPDSKSRQNFSGTYLYHSEWKDRAVIKAMVNQGWNGAAVQELLDSGAEGGKFLTDSQRQEDAVRKNLWKRHKFRKSYYIDEGWLDILDENGDVIFPNALMIHSGGKILYGPVENPIWATDLNTGRRKWPFIATSPLTDPTIFEGRGIVEQDAPLSWLYSNVFMLWADGLNWLINPPTEVNQDVLVDSEDLDHYPGRLWAKRGDTPALTPAKMGQMDSASIMGALQYIDQTRQNSNFVTDFAVGLPGTRSDITKGEVQIKTSQSLSIFEAMAKNMEHMGREAVELCYDLALQFYDDFSDPAIVSAIGPEKAQILQQMPLQEKVETLQGDFKFTFTGVTQALQKTDQLQKVLQFATLIASPGYAGYVAPDQMLRVIGDLLGVTDRIQIKDAQTVQQEQMAMAQQQMQMQAQAQAPQQQAQQQQMQADMQMKQADLGMKQKEMDMKLRHAEQMHQQKMQQTQETHIGNQERADFAARIKAANPTPPPAKK